MVFTLLCHTVWLSGDPMARELQVQEGIFHQLTSQTQSHRTVCTKRYWKEEWMILSVLFIFKRKKNAFKKSEIGSNNHHSPPHPQLDIFVQLFKKVKPWLCHLIGERKKLLPVILFVARTGEEQTLPLEKYSSEKSHSWHTKAILEEQKVKQFFLASNSWESDTGLTSIPSSFGERES